MSAEKGNACTICGRARSATNHVRGAGAYSHDWVRAPKARKRPSYMGRSEQGQANADQWALDKETHLAEHPDCEAKSFLAGKCAGEIDVHHIQPRSAGGTQYDDGPLASLCRLHHSAIENERQRSRLLGLLVRRDLPAELRATAPIGED